jgi:hypothetical protein
MAKVTSPLMSLDASGAFAGAIVFSKWKGRHTVRQLVTPANPMSTNQVSARNKVRAGGAMQHFANVATAKSDGSSYTDKEMLIAAAPSGFAWNGWLVEKLIGAGAVGYTAAEAAYAALTSGNKTTWDTAADALTPAIPAVAQFLADNAPTTALSSGHVFYLYRYALYLAGIKTAPVAGTPPTYA